MRRRPPRATRTDPRLPYTSLFRSYLEAMYGALRAGLVATRVSTKLGLQGLVQSIEECGAEVVVVDPLCNPAAVDAAASVPHKIILGGEAGPGWIAYDALLESAPSRFDPPAIQSTAIGELCFTSGSTGRPKAVMISHRATLLKLHCYGNDHRAMDRKSVV